MKQTEILLSALVLIATGTITVSGQAPDKSRLAFLSVLTEGQTVNMKELSGQYEFSFFDDRQIALSHKVIDLGSDYMTVNDVSDLTETRIPIYSIKSIVKNKLPK